MNYKGKQQTRKIKKIAKLTMDSINSNIEGKYEKSELNIECDSESCCRAKRENFSKLQNNFDLTQADLSQASQQRSWYEMKSTNLPFFEPSWNEQLQPISIVPVNTSEPKFSVINDVHLSADRSSPLVFNNTYSNCTTVNINAQYYDQTRNVFSSVPVAVILPNYGQQQMTTYNYIPYANFPTEFSDASPSPIMLSTTQPRSLPPKPLSITTNSPETKKFYCHYCDKAFQKLNYLKQHNNAHHVVKLFKCHICGKKFDVKEKLDEHATKHFGVKRFQCKNCPKSFNYNSDLKRHGNVHGIKPFECVECQKRFIRKDHMMKHMETHERKKEALNHSKRRRNQQKQTAEPELMHAII